MNDYANVDYARLTTGDRNPLKRFLQSNRLNDGLRSLASLPAGYSGRILDFGAGNGELCRRIHARLPAAALVCYEPVRTLREQARALLRDVKTARIEATLDNYAPNHFDYIFCLEVFEHLPEKETVEALDLMQILLKNDGVLVVGVPNEIYLPALIKGIFRIRRRYGDDDARPGNVLRAALGFPPKNRRVVSFGGVPYILRHIGFDHRRFRDLLADRFAIETQYGSPRPDWPLALNFEVYLVCRKS